MLPLFLSLLVAVAGFVRSSAARVDSPGADDLFLWEKPLLAWSMDYATICPTVFSAIVLTAYAMCSGPSTAVILARAVRAVLRGIAGSSIWRALSKGDLLGLVLLVIGNAFDTAYALLRPQWAESIYSDLAISEETATVGALL
ncbi:hypothetical protein FQN49_006711, partial [Arthroderma sp. PD_2]